MNKRILIDATNVTITVHNGGSFCTQAYMEAVLALYPGQVDVLHPQEAHIRDSRYRTIDVPRRNGIQRVLGFLCGRFYRSASFLMDYLREHQEEYEMVMINTGLYAGCNVKALHNLGLRIVVLHHNFEPEYRMDSKSILTLKGRTDRLVRYWERKGYRGADINLFLTRQDCARFEQEYGAHAHNYVTSIFETRAERQPLVTHDTTKSAVITCALGDIQNQAPLLRFAEQYLSIFRRILPDWTIHLMGRNPSKAIRNMVEQHDCMTLTPNPENIRELAAQSTIYLCPMDAGGGLKLRLMDGLRSGQPVLVHERSARGYDALLGTPYFCTYNDPESFENGLIQILHYLRSADYSRATVQDKHYELFGLEVGIERLRSILCK